MSYQKSLNFELENDFALITFHPVTLEDSSALDQIKELLKACDNYPDLTLVLQKQNADAEVG